MSFDASSDHKESNASAGIGASNQDGGDRGDNTPAMPGGPRPDVGNPSHYGGTYGGQAAPSSFSQTMTRQWNLFLHNISKPKNIGRAVGLAIGGPVYGLLAAPLTGWAFDKISKMEFNTPNWSRPATDFTSSGNSMNPLSDTDGGKSRTYLDQQKARIQGIQQQAWMSYLQGQDPKKKPVISDDTYKGLLS